MRKDGFSLLTFNIFVGSPHPPSPCTKAVPSLGSSNRLQLQLDGILEVGADIVCVQEAYCDYCAECYTQLSPKYDFCLDRHSPTLCSYIALAAIVSVVIFCVHLPLSVALPHVADCPDTMGYFVVAWYGISIVVVLLFLARNEFSRGALVAWLSGGVAGGVLVLFDRETFELVESKSRLFEHQGGDFLNFFRPRGYNQLCLRHKGQNMQLLVTNVHLNLGGDASRQRQLLEVCNPVVNGWHPGGTHIVCGDFNAGPSAHSIHQMAKHFDFKDCWKNHAPANEMGDTWCKRNKLTHAVFDQTDDRVDYIFYKSSIFKCNFVSTVFDRPPYVSDHFGVLATFVVSD